jgi:NADPH-dependent 2,4-dienoyl-CoA reductase/sulfur reductase-like enzyme
VQVYQVVESGLRRIAESEGEAHGDRMPGMAVPVGAGAAMGRAASSAAISGGMNVMQEVTGGLDKSVKNLAEELAERAVSFYTRQGWL